jgi:hypothetical protein
MKASIYNALQKADEVKTLPALVALGGMTPKPPVVASPHRSRRFNPYATVMYMKL